VAGRRQRDEDVATDEAARPGDENAHGYTET
jgi:hypothetical protein